MASLREITARHTYNKHAKQLADRYVPEILAMLRNGRTVKPDSKLTPKQNGAEKMPDAPAQPAFQAQLLPIPEMIHPDKPDLRANGYQPDRQDLEALEEFPL